jgi:hypothetical protein
MQLSPDILVRVTHPLIVDRLAATAPSPRQALKNILLCL